VNHPSMTTRGRMIAALIGITIAFMLPKRIDCAPGGVGCKRIGQGVGCSLYEIEPFGFFLLEQVVRRNVGFAYERADSCHN
jgi:hypothetical protein